MGDKYNPSSIMDLESHWLKFTFVIDSIPSNVINEISKVRLLNDLRQELLKASSKLLLK